MIKKKSCISSGEALKPVNKLGLNKKEFPRESSVEESVVWQHNARVFECIIIGAGPSGITAAIYLARRKLSLALVYETLGGQASLTTDIENYSGFKFISGEEFSRRLMEHLQGYDITPVRTRVTSVNRSRGLIIVKTNEGTLYSKTVIFAAGARQKRLGIPGEEEFLNKGVAYCATCDAPLFTGKDVAIIGGANSALEAAIQLQRYARTIKIITVNDRMEGEEIMIEKVTGFNNIQIISGSRAVKITGDRFVENLTYLKENREVELTVQGVFIEIGYIPNSELLDAKKNRLNEIVIDEKNQTSIPGIFAAGDVTNIGVKQIIVAAGEGAKAAVAVSEYLNRLKL